jgi:hypothetical protein
MRVTSSRILIIAALVAFVASVLPGAWEYLTVKACLETGIMTPTGSYCPLGEERLPVLAIHWIRMPTAVSIVMAFLVAILASLLFTLVDWRRRSRVAV